MGALILAWPFIAWAAARGLIKNSSLERADAVVVLSGASNYAERARRAAELYREGRAPRILLTDDDLRGGWSKEKETNPLFVERAREELMRAGVPEERIETLPGKVSSTYEEAVAARSYAEKTDARSLLFVTSAYHTRRALWTMRTVFQGSGVEVGVESAEAGKGTPAPFDWWLRGEGWRVVALEYPKLFYYYFEYG